MAASLGEYRKVTPIALAAASTGTSDAGPAVAVVLGVVVIWWVSTHGKGGAALRLIAWVLLPVMVWLLIAVHDPAQAGHIASGAASGVSVAISSISRLAGAL
jgi:hypothetical protein